MNSLSGNYEHDNDSNDDRDPTHFQTAQDCLLALMIMQVFRWFWNLFIVQRHPYITIPAQVPAPQAQPVPNGVSLSLPQMAPPPADVLRSSSLIPPHPANNIDAATGQPKTGMKKWLSFLPVSGNYFVKNPTEKQLNDFKNKKWTKDELLCKVCFTNNSNTIVNVCGHGGMCDECGRDIMKKFGACMLCRKKIDRLFIVKPPTEFGKVEVVDEIKV